WIDVAQIWLGGPSGPGWIPARALGGGSSEEWGWAASGIGDTDGDGFGEVAVGGPLDGDGTVVILGGHPDLVTTAPLAVTWGEPIPVEVDSAFPSTEITLATSARNVRVGRCFEDLAGLCTGLAHARRVDTRTAGPDGVGSFVADPPLGLVPGETAWFVGVSVIADGDWTAVERSSATPVAVRSPGTTY
ncbi:MAG: integrin alpha, partial [Myxococcota bacterium]